MAQQAPQKPSYLWAMLSHPLNLNLVLGTTALATVLSIPYGLAGFSLPLLMLGAGELIASMFIPSSIVFKEKVDRAYKNTLRAKTIAHLTGEINKLVGKGTGQWHVHEQMLSRTESLRDLAQSRPGIIRDKDFDRLTDSCTDFLSLWLAKLVIEARQETVDESNVESRIATLAKKISEGAEDSHSLKKAKADLEELLLRHRRLVTRKPAVEAAMLSLPDAVEEIYHAVVTMPASAQGDGRLQDAIDRLRLQEELDTDINDFMSPKITHSVASQHIN